MVSNILETLEKTVTWLPEKTAFRDEKNCLTFRRLYEQSRAIGSFLLSRRLIRQPVVVFMKRSTGAVAAFFGTIYGGCYCIPMEEDTPPMQMERILSRVQPKMILCDERTAPSLSGTAWAEQCVMISAAVKAGTDEAALAQVRRNQTDADPVCVLFTSGSSGEPKGIPVSHRVLLNAAEYLGAVLRCSSNTSFGSLASMMQMTSLQEMILTVKHGGACVLLPANAPRFPMKLVEILNREGVNTVYWPASALAAISAADTFRCAVPEQLGIVAFSGEEFPQRQLALWRKVLPDARFLRLYSPEEAAGIGCFYEIPEQQLLDGAIPLGQPFPNTEILLLDAQGRVGKRGEICIRSDCMISGYYRDERGTEKSFVQNPENPDYPERIFRTGDYGTYNARGELMFLERKDNRIEFHGRQIELGEIEAAALSFPGVQFACSQFDEKADRIQLFYTGPCTCAEMISHLRTYLPRAVIPRAVYRMEFMPLTPAGKIDRMLLKNNSRKGIYAYEAADAS